MGNMADGFLLGWICSLHCIIPMSTRTRIYAFPDDTEHNSNNKSFGIVYDNTFLRVMLLAHTNLSDNLASSQKNYVCRLFDQRQAWKLGTIFRAIFCRILFFKAGAGFDARVLQQIEPNYQPNEHAGFNLYDLLFSGSDSAPLHLHDANKSIAQLNWSEDLDHQLFKLRQTDKFMQNEAFMTAHIQVKCHLIPTHMRNDDDVVRTVREMIAICASFRMWRDGISAHGAFSLVISARGFTSKFFC